MLNYVKIMDAKKKKKVLVLNYQPNEFISATAWVTAIVSFRFCFLTEAFNFKTHNLQSAPGYSFSKRGHIM